MHNNSLPRSLKLYPQHLYTYYLGLTPKFGRMVQLSCMVFYLLGSMLGQYRLYHFLFIRSSGFGLRTQLIFDLSC